MRLGWSWRASPPGVAGGGGPCVPSWPFALLWDGNAAAGNDTVGASEGCALTRDGGGGCCRGRLV